MDRVAPQRYFEAAQMAREARLWRSVWLCAGRSGVSGPSAVWGEFAQEEIWAGFRWVHGARDPEPLASYLGRTKALVEAHGVADWQTEVAVTTELACNWKTSVDAHNESYHVRALHPEVLEMVDAENADVELLGIHSRIRVPMHAAPVDRLPEHSALSENQLTDNHQLYLFPNLQLNLFADHGMAFRHRPHPTDPERCWFDMYVLTRRGTGGAVRLREVVNDDEVFGPVTGADLAMLPKLQQGMRSPGFAGLVLGDGEACIRNMHVNIERYLIDT